VKSRKQWSCSNSERKNEFETGDSDDVIADGDAENLFCTELFLERSAWREMDPLLGE